MTARHTGSVNTSQRGMLTRLGSTGGGGGGVMASARASWPRNAAFSSRSLRHSRSSALFFSWITALAAAASLYILGRERVARKMQSHREFRRLVRVLHTSNLALRAAISAAEMVLLLPLLGCLV